MTAVWHVYDGTNREGPVSDEEIERRHAAGELGPSALVWREGWPDWRPIAAALAWMRSDREAKAAKLPEVKRARAPAPIAGTVIVLLIVALAAAGIRWLFAALGDVVEKANPAEVVQSYQLLVWGIAAGLAAVIVPLWWLTGRVRRWRPTSVAPGLVRGLLVLSALLGAAFVALQLRLTDVVQETAIEVASQTADVGFRPAGRWVTLKGEIGPHFTDQVAQALRAHPDAAGILIDSPGGLTKQALDVAHMIEERGLDVRVERRCISACIAILVSGRRRTAEWSAQIALHASAPVSDQYPAFMKLATEPSRREFEGYVALHRMPKAWIDEAEAVGPTRVRPTPPPDLLNAGVLTAVTRDGVPLSAVEAKWLWVETQTKDSGLIDILEAIRTDDPDAVKASADELYSGVDSGDAARASSAFQAVLSGIVRRAQLSAADEPAYLYVESQLEQLADFTQHGNWPLCVAYLGGRAGNAGSPALLQKEQQALAALIHSAGQSGWQAREVGPDALDAGREASALAAARLSAAGAGEPDRSRCLRSFYVLQAIDQQGPERGVEAWRALLQTARR